MKGQHCTQSEFAVMTPLRLLGVTLGEIVALVLLFSEVESIERDLFRIDTPFRPQNRKFDAFRAKWVLP